ncbi:MAG: hypothetical protein ACKOWJ_05110 [Micrococcales bacterium]
MTFTLNGGIGLAVVVGLWLVIMVPNWNRTGKDENRVSTKGRNFSRPPVRNSKNPRIGVSKSEKFRNKNRAARRIFSTLLLVSVALMVHGLIQFQSNVVWLLESVAGGFLFSFSASVLRATRVQPVRYMQTGGQQSEQDRLRMAYFIRESALEDVSPDELFDERVWRGSQIPESSLNRRVGAIDMSALAEIVSLEQVRSNASGEIFDSEQLDAILKRRRAGK